MDFAALPPEINSTRMYAGAGSAPMWTAATAWEGLGAELSSAAAAYRAVVSGLTRETWRGPASMSMQAAAIGYASWLSTTGEQVKQAARQASAAAAAYETAFGATVPPALVTHNRAVLTSLVATNIVGQNTPAIATTEAIYSEMWAQDATAMYAYASGSAAASRLSAFTDPPQTTDPTGVSGQDAAVGRATSSSAASSPKAFAQVMSTVPNVLQTMAGETSDPSPFLNVGAGGTYIASGVLFILGPLLTGPIAGALPTTSLGFAAPALGAAGAAALLSDTTPIAPSVGRAGVLAGLSRAGSVGGLSVPQAWGGVTGEMPRAVMAIPAPALVGFPEAEVDPLGTGGGGMLPGSLMAAAAGGGGAAGGGYAATRGAGSAQRNGTAQPGGTTPPDESKRARYRPPASVIPQAARGADVGGRLPGQSGLRDQGGESWSPETLRDEINDLRKQLTDMAMERDVLMRSLSLWARGSLEE
jgi:PPE-repeat protein